jgi:hypothetical protein
MGKTQSGVQCGWGKARLTPATVGYGSGSGPHPQRGVAERGVRTRAARLEPNLNFFPEVETEK